jgi:hypothetical protein
MLDGGLRQLSIEDEAVVNQTLCWVPRVFRQGCGEQEGRPKIRDHRRLGVNWEGTHPETPAGGTAWSGFFNCLAVHLT